MKRLLILIIAVISISGYFFKTNNDFNIFSAIAEISDNPLRFAYESKQSDIQVYGVGKVKRKLPDDNFGSRHQRFILQIEDGMTVLVAHNIDLANRIPNLNSGDTVEFYGEYEWNVQGGILHWTHHDPAGRHEHGWLKHKGKVYQ